MNLESKIIELINHEMPQSPLRKSISGEVDSEVILLGDKEYLFTTDDFSREDLLREHDPYILGWNIACGMISDVIASGGKPLTYSHSMVIPGYWDDIFIKRFSQGISKVLKRYAISFIGGDLSLSDHWRYTASLIGKPGVRIINRHGCQAGDSIFLTGKIGAGNLDAVFNLYSYIDQVKLIADQTTNKFTVHDKLPDLIAKYASSAIDTSDGVLSALLSITELNNTGFKINNLHFHSKGRLLSKTLNLPQLLLFAGECGEYEILFTVNKSLKNSLSNELTRQKIKAYEIGLMTDDSTQKLVSYHKKEYNFAKYNIKARDFKQVHEYLKSMIEWIISQ